ncbi:MAG: acyl-CoA dehydrogenase family protein [Coleofasciculaceae cyanobacterium]
MLTQQHQDEQQALLKLAHSYLQESVAPQASAIDNDSEVLINALRGMGDRSLLALRVPKSWGGAGVSQETYRYFQQLVPRYSGALAFLNTQHQSAGSMLAKSENHFLKQQYLPEMGQGKVLVGVGFSQLRRKGDPVVKALAVEGGYQLTGKVPWVTGFRIFQNFIVGATLPDSRAVYGIVPFTATNQLTSGAIVFSQPMQLAAMQSTNTVSATLTNWFLAQESVVFIKPAGAIDENDRRNVLHHSFFALGCAQAGLDIIETAAKVKQLNFIEKAFDSLLGEFTHCQKAIMSASSEESKSFAEKLELRAWAINLAGRSAQAAVTVSSGAANYKHHGAGRVYREALVFTVSGQTTAVMEATLNKLLRSGGKQV